MSDRSGFDPSNPWHIKRQRGEQLITIETFSNATQVIRYVATLPSPETVIVSHEPSERSGNGAQFLEMVNHRIPGNN